MGLFNRFTRNAGKAINANAFEAAVAAGILVSASDEEIGKKETDKLEKLIINNDTFAAFKKPEVQKQITKYAGTIEADFRLGKLKLMKEIEDVADNADSAEQVLITAIAVAEASDDGIGAKEYKILNEIASVLGLALKDYDVEAPAAS